MISKIELQSLLIEAIIFHGGKATIVEICKYIWNKYKNQLENSGDLLYTWQYDIRWAATQLRHKGILKSTSESSKGIWFLSEEYYKKIQSK
ncbi:hypothetical protein JV173_00210 [Acholeplasma equirhinis]|uniref:hypothetical protein n=1 Tax=Acholeplasma equirhinis TaxID=555393 RepID=UPI00197AD028|nr:hypothetical protein [Acholeplasma equirhinis]MBN3489925.1 hypothetical protein [Acholeplasma equirhinis]